MQSCVLTVSKRTSNELKNILMMQVKDNPSVLRRALWYIYRKRECSPSMEESRQTLLHIFAVFNYSFKAITLQRFHPKLSKTNTNEIKLIDFWPFFNKCACENRKPITVCLILFNSHGETRLHSVY